MNVFFTPLFQYWFLYLKQGILIVLIFRIIDVNTVSFSYSMQFKNYHKDKLINMLRHCLTSCILYKSRV